MIKPLCTKILLIVFPFFYYYYYYYCYYKIHNIYKYINQVRKLMAAHGKRGGQQHQAQAIRYHWSRGYQGTRAS